MGGFERAQDEGNPLNVAQLCFSRLCLTCLCPWPRSQWLVKDKRPLNIILKEQAEDVKTFIPLRVIVLPVLSLFGFSEGLALSFLKESSVWLYKQGYTQWHRITTFFPSVNRWISQRQLHQPGRGRGTGGWRVRRVHVLLRRSRGRAADLYGCSTSSLCASEMLLLKPWGMTVLVA